MSHNEYIEGEIIIMGHKKDLLHKDIKGWGIVSGNYFRGDPDAPMCRQKKTPIKHIYYLHNC